LVYIFTLLYANQWYYTYILFMTRVRYYARAIALSSQKEMAATLALEAVEKQSCAMGVQVFEIGLFDPNAAEGTMLPRLWNLDTLLRSVSWLR
jgi:hypothetical protein